MNADAAAFQSEKRKLADTTNAISPGNAKRQKTGSGDPKILTGNEPKSPSNETSNDFDSSVEDMEKEIKIAVTHLTVMYFPWFHDINGDLVLHELVDSNYDPRKRFDEAEPDNQVQGELQDIILVLRCRCLASLIENDGQLPKWVYDIVSTFDLIYLEYSYLSI